MFVYVTVFVCVCTYVAARGLSWVSFLRHCLLVLVCLFCFLVWFSFVKKSLSTSQCWLAQGSACFPASSPGITGVHHSHACMASAGPKELSSQTSRNMNLWTKYFLESHLYPGWPGFHKPPVLWLHVCSILSKTKFKIFKNHKSLNCHKKRNVLISAYNQLTNLMKFDVWSQEKYIFKLNSEFYRVFF